MARDNAEIREPGIPLRAVAAGCVLLFWFIAPSSSWAYRPFISTDAAVADPHEVEIEFGYLGLEREKGENAFSIPRVVLNYGLFKNWEAVAEFALRRAPAADVNLIDPCRRRPNVLRC